MKYFTSDWHINEDRIGLDGKPNLFYRDFHHIGHQNFTLYNSLYSSSIQPEDEFIHLGDVIYKINDTTKECFDHLKIHHPGKWTLIVGNYDEDKLDFLSNYFEEITHSKEIEILGRKYYLNHYPKNCVDKEFSITGHIHGAWRVQKNMINVGVDAWNYKVVDENRIDFLRTACEEHYDVNVFPY